MSLILPEASVFRNRQGNALQVNQHAGLSFILCGPETESNSLAHDLEPNHLPSRTPIICFHGSGNDTHYNTWLPLVEDIAKSTTILFYERRGVGQVEQVVSPSATPRESLIDLIGLLDRLHLRPPYILLAHSYGGTIAREFLQSYPNRVAGMVLAETGQETPTSHDQEQYKRQILGLRPLSVIHADSLHGKRDANASAEVLKMQELWTEEDKRMKMAQLQLSSNARYIHVDSCGHNVMRDRPDVVRQEVDWVLENVIVSIPAKTHYAAHFLRYITCIIQQRKI